MAETVLVLGASGLFGSQAAKAYAAAGWTVRTYRRGTDLVAAANGVDVIVNALNPPNYHAWNRIIPRITADVIAAGLAAGATIVVPGNVYVYGDQAGPWGPDTPQRPCARKGAIRVQMERDYRAATERGLRVIVLRGGDFVLPGAANSFWDRIALKSVGRGKIVSAAAPGVRRAYAYLPDMARAAVELSARRDSLPAFADIPFAGVSLSMEEIAEGIARLTGRPMRVVPFPWWLMRLAGPFWELARELNEMRYLWQTPHALDPAPLAHWLPAFPMTPLRDVLRAELKALAPELLLSQGGLTSTQIGR